MRRWSYRTSVCPNLFVLSLSLTLIYCRMYEGSNAVLVTSDPDIIKEVYIKQFNNFYGRRVSLYPRVQKWLSRNHLFLL